ncbi:methyltransferase domain-containing protein [Olivibacter sp. SDN3]|uniref:SAM-dependent methyltransferase n=1 Tax=Olivibacter sp. SDN3 TaxID=2764720 RepID=UPI0016517538|nr:methyltransferase domain-containing protein [Olivibacter sp. SDN3]QNL52315.1 methyltransferase domain-containing protein [Olivibacter sp. SDN3]
MKTVKNLLVALFVGACTVAYAQEPQLDVPYVPTNQQTVEKMLELANIKPDDVVYDLGCGDGRIIVTAAKKFGVTGVGVDLNPQRIREANENAEKAGVTDKVKFVEGNLFEFDFSKADVVTMYLLPSVNMKLRSKLLKELKPGSRIVSHDFDMGDWEAEKTVKVGNDTVYLWTID